MYDVKIDSAISDYISGIKTKREYDLDSLLNQLKSYHFVKNFNYFGKKTNIGDYDDRLVVPNYGVESYNYYYMLAQSSVQGAAPSTYFSSAHSVSYPGEFTGTAYGIRFYTGTISIDSFSRPVAFAFSVSPMDTAWASYDSNALPGTVINESEDCYFIKNNELATLGMPRR